MAQAPPMPGLNPLEEMEMELETIMAVEEQVVMSQAPVVEASAGASNLISEKSKKLRPEQQEQLQSKNDDLKVRYDDLSTRVKSRKQDLESNINLMRTEQEQQSTMSRRFGDVGGTLQELLDWMVQTEQKLGSQQPINEQTKPLSSQLDRHRVLREDIVAHDQPISKNVNDIAILLREFGGKLKPEDESFLRTGLDELKPRYDEVNKQSITRQNKLDSALDDLEKYREEFDEFEE